MPSLVDEHGHFFSNITLFDKSDVNEDEVMLELNAQYQAALDAGLRLTISTAITLVVYLNL